MTHRIWELDAFRGICIIGMVLVHFVLDLTEVYHLVDWDFPGWFSFVRSWGGVLFLLLSGICVTLGSRSLRRGLIVFGCGLLVTAVTATVYFLGMFQRNVIVYFGILHCLGCCMMLWPLFRQLSPWAVTIAAIVMVAVGIWMDTLPGIPAYGLMPFGLHWVGFWTVDYFPLLPYLGFFLLGTTLGRTLYGQKQTLLPKANLRNPMLRFLTFCGRHSLWIYLLHQPVLIGLLLPLT